MNNNIKTILFYSGIARRQGNFSPGLPLLRWRSGISNPCVAAFIEGLSNSAGSRSGISDKNSFRLFL
ncbi:MAG: hypothetical protein ACQESM_02255 [Bacteroidota bacterium]